MREFIVYLVCIGVTCLSMVVAYEWGYANGAVAEVNKRVLKRLQGRDI